MEIRPFIVYRVAGGLASCHAGHIMQVMGGVELTM